MCRNISDNIAGNVHVGAFKYVALLVFDVKFPGYNLRDSGKRK
jgi:hypothetical protein